MDALALAAMVALSGVQEWRLQGAPEEGRRVPYATDETTKLVRAYERIKSGGVPPPPGASKYKYLLVKGVSFDTRGDQLQQNCRRLRELGLEAEIVSQPMSESPGQNAGRVADAIREAGRPVVIIGYSFGGLTSLLALEQDDSLAKDVYALVGLQTPYFGTPSADRAFQGWRGLLSPFFDEAGGLLDFATGGRYRPPSEEILRFTTRERRAGLPRSRPDIGKDIRLYSIVTQVDPGSAALARKWKDDAAYLRGVAGASNGLVVAGEAVIPGSRYAWLADLAHCNTAKAETGVIGRDPDLPGDLTEAILHWLF